MRGGGEGDSAKWRVGRFERGVGVSYREGEGKRMGEGDREGEEREGR